eukprot:5829143-Alexandrium_andersonii.AAC.1
MAGQWRSRVARAGWSGQAGSGPFLASQAVTGKIADRALQERWKQPLQRRAIQVGLRHRMLVLQTRMCSD